MTEADSTTNSGDDFSANAKEAARILEADLKAGADFIARVLTLRTASRAVVVSLVSALAVYSLTNHAWAPAVVGLIVATTGLLSEAHSEFIQSITHNRLTRLEHKVQSYISYLIEDGPVANDAKRRLTTDLATYQFGTSRSLRGSSILKTLRVAWRTLGFWLHACLILLMIFATILGFVGNDNADAGICFRTASGTQIQVHEMPVISGGPIEMIPCPGR
jgi:hypothetical protein